MSTWLQRLRRQRPCGLLVILTLCAAARLQAQDVPAAREPLTLEASVLLGLERNGRIRAADADAAAARALEREARAALLPSLRSAGSYTRLGGDLPEAQFSLPGLDTAFPLLQIERDRYHFEVSVEQPLFTGGRLAGGVRAAVREAAAAELLAEQERADVAYEIRHAYWTLYGALGRLQATEAARLRVEAHLTDVRSRFDAGSVLRAEVLAAQTRRSEIALDRVEAQNAVELSRLELNRLTGLPLGTDVPLAAVVEPTPLPDPETVTGRAVLRPELQALAEQVAALRARLSATRGGRLPDLAFVSRYVYARPNPYVFTTQSSFHGTWETGLSVQWSAWEGGAQAARTAQIREQLRAAESRLDVARLQVEVDARRQYLEARRAAEAIAVAAENVEQAGESLRVVRQQFMEGAALSADVLDAEQAFQQAQARHARAEAEYGSARAALLRVLGVVW